MRADNHRAEFAVNHVIFAGEVADEPAIVTLTRTAARVLEDSL